MGTVIEESGQELGQIGPVLQLLAPGQQVAKGQDDGDDGIEGQQRQGVDDQTQGFHPQHCRVSLRVQGQEGWGGDDAGKPQQEHRQAGKVVVAL